jgi:hypothetical protein
MRYLPAFLLAAFVISAASAQTVPTLYQLRERGSKLLDAKLTDQEKKPHADFFLKGLELFLEENGPDSVSVQSLPFMSCLSSPDGLVRVYTWALKRSDDSYQNFGLVYVKPAKKGEPRIFVLDDKSETLKNTELKNLGRNSWLGCVYYGMYEISKGSRPMYLLLGYGGHYPPVRRKVAEILTFSNTGEVQFGAPVFQTETKTFNRIVLEYSAKANVSMKYYPERRMLVYDFLAPQSEKHLGNPAFYGPVGSYDAFELKGKIFKYVKDVDARNPDENKGNTAKPVEKKIPPRQ